MKISRRWIIRIGFLLALTVGLFVFKKEQDEAILREHFGDKVFYILKNAERTEVFRLHDLFLEDSTQLANKKKVLFFPIKYQGKDPGEKFTKELSTLLRSRRVFYKMADGLYFPTVAFRVWSGNDSATILISFWQNHLDVWGPDYQKAHHQEYAKESLDFLRPKLMKLAKEAFPRDKEIQALK